VCACLAEEFLEAAVAVGLVVLLLEGALVQLPQTEGAGEVLGVVLAEHGRDAPPSDGLVAAGAEGAPLGVVVRLAVRQPLVVEEGAPVERLLAVPTDEALGMPLAVQRGDVVLHDGGAAAAALGREHVVVVLATVRLAVLLVEAVLPERLPALCAEEVVGMPVPI